MKAAQPVKGCAFASVVKESKRVSLERSSRRNPPSGTLILIILIIVLVLLPFVAANWLRSVSHNVSANSIAGGPGIMNSESEVHASPNAREVGLVSSSRKVGPTAYN